jgi:hypothetical protein
LASIRGFKFPEPCITLGQDTALSVGQSGEPAIVPGQVEQSALLRFVQDQVEDLEMPPLGIREKFPALSKEEISNLRN